MAGFILRPPQKIAQERQGSGLAVLRPSGFNILGDRNYGALQKRIDEPQAFIDGDMLLGLRRGQEREGVMRGEIALGELLAA